MGSRAHLFLVAGRLPTVALGALLALALTGCGNGGVPDGLSTSALSKATAEPTRAELAKTGPLKEMTLGNAEAPITMIEYASLGCPVCSVFHKTVFPKFKKAYVDTGKVRFIYREFPIGKSPLAAAHAARCVPEALYFETNDQFLLKRGRWNAREPDNSLLYKIVQETGLTRAAFDNCMANQKIKEGIVWVKQRGRELGVKGTPTFFINGQHIRGHLSFDELRELLDKHLKIAAKPA